MLAELFGSKTTAIRMNFNNGTSVLKLLWNERQIVHSIEGEIRKEVDFDSLLAERVIGLTSQMLGQIFSGSIDRFPETQKVLAGVSDSPFLRELQMNYNRMLTNSEVDQVKLFFQKTIDDIKAGRIKVEQ